MNKRMTITKRIIGTLALPLVMYFLMMALAYSNGKMYYGTLAMWKTLIVNIALSITTALGIGLQFKSGRFDFSGGAIMLLSSIIAGNVAISQGNDLKIFFLLALALCVLFSLLVALVYVFGRLPIIIATIGMTLFYESLTTLLYKGGGVNLVANMSMRRIATFPLVLIPLGGAILVYVFFSHFTKVGKQGELLANNQQAAVHIGINENRNVLISYLYSGLIFGFATMIFASSALHRGAFSSLVTVGSLFSNILPVFIGLMLAKYSGDTLGIIAGSVTLSLMSYGLTAVFSAEMGSAISIIITGIFILGINVISSQGSQWMELIRRQFRTTEVERR